MIGATGGPTQGHLVYARNTARWWFFTWSGVSLTTGTATGGDSGKLVDTSKTWTASEFQGQSCYLTGGPGAGEVFEIGPNGTNFLPVQNNGSPGNLQTAPGNGTTYEVIDTRHVRAYVSSGSDLATATWAAATGGISPQTPNNTGLDMTGGRNDGGGFGEYPVDGRLLSVGYADANGVDVVVLLTQQNLHWMKLSERARLGIGTAETIVWDMTGLVTWEDRFAERNECAPSFLQGLAVGVSSTGRWHALQVQNFFGVGGYPATVLDDGTYNSSRPWGGVRGTFDTTVGLNAHQSALAALGSGEMLAVYVKGTRDSGFGAVTHQNGLRYTESTGEQWSTSNVGKDVPNLSNASQHPNDWSICKVSDTDIHAVRRNSATVLEQVRYSGRGGSWSAKVTLPSNGLTGQLAGSGVATASNGTDLWAFVIDTDSGHSVKYLKWTSASGWDSSWTALPGQDSAVKNFVAATYGNGQIGVSWTVGSTSPYAVMVAKLATP